MRLGILIKLEEAAILIAAYLFTLILGYSWWMFPILLFIPEISVVGYLFNSKTGAILYNIFHNRVTAIAAGTIGVLSGEDQLLLCGIVLFGHTGMDRMLGFGLRYWKGFRYNHLEVSDEMEK